MKSLIVMASLLLIQPVVAAEVYRWTDQSGRVHYGQRPPSGEAERMELPDAEPAGSVGEDDLTRRRERERRLLESYDYERAQKKARRASEERAQRNSAEQCRKLEQYWQRLSFPGPLYVTRADGERDYLSDEQRTAEKVRVKPAYERACGREP